MKLEVQRTLLHGVRVLDVSRALAGPFCTQMLGDLGADVIKIERPGQGDESRGWGPPFVDVSGESISAYYLSCNRNKRSITLDLARPEGQQVLDQLVPRSDILVENYRGSSVAGVGLDPTRLLHINPRLIVCSISGFGRTGPWRDLAGYDFAIQALSGLMSLTGPVDGPPTRVAVAIVDILTGLNASTAVLACLRARERTGHGYHIDLALLDSAVAAQINVVQAYLATRQLPPRQGNGHLQIVPYQLFATLDSWLILTVGNDQQWQHFCRAAGRNDLAQNQRFHTNAGRVNHREGLLPQLTELLKTQTTAQWQKLLEPLGVPCSPLWNHADLFAHPQAEARGLRLTITDPKGHPVDLVGSPFHIHGPHGDVPSPQLFPPAQGEHTQQILGELLGLDASEIEQLRQKGIV